MKKIMLTVALQVMIAVAGFADAQSDFANNVADYNRQLAAGKFADAAKSAALASAACVEVKNYSGAFDILSGMERTLASKRVSADSLPEAYYRIAKAKFDIYSKLRNSGSAQSWLEKMVKYAGQSNSKKIKDSMLFSAARFYYSAGQKTKGDQCLSRLVAQQGGGADGAFRSIIGRAMSLGDAKLVGHIYENYMMWTDSVGAVNAGAELGKIKKKYDDSRKTIAEKDRAISGKKGLVATFVTLFVVALALLAAGGMFCFRVMATNRRMKKKVDEANERNAAKSALLGNMSTTVGPALEKLDQDNPDVRNLRKYIRQVGELSEVDGAGPKDAGSLDEVNIEQFGKTLADEVRPLLRPDVKLHIVMPRGVVRIDEGEVHKILAYLLENAAKHTPEGGRVSLTYKKRGAKCHQFIVSDTGPGIPAEKRDTLFKPFCEPGADLAGGDGLGLPICALRAEKMNGTLELGSHHKGATFVLTIRS